MLSLVFSVPVSAREDVVFENLKVDISNKFYVKDLYSAPLSYSMSIYPNNGTQESYTYTNTTQIIPEYSYFYSFQTWKFSNVNGDILLKSGQLSKITLQNGYYNVGFTLKNTSSGNIVSSSYFADPDLKALIFYYDGTMEYVELTGTAGRPSTLYIEDFTPQKDVIAIEYQFTSSVVSTGSLRYAIPFYTLGEYTGDNSFNLMATVQSEEAGLLSGIIGWIKNIFNSIADLPFKIWEFISNGLKSLFVPSEEFLTKFKDDMDTLLSQKLGAVYQVVHLLTEGWDKIQANDTSNTIDFPEVTIPLPDNNEFKFGGQQVAIVPDGFDFLVTAIKTIVGICCTILFVNGLKRRYDEIMGG